MNWTIIIIVLLNVFVILFIKLHDQNKYIKTKNGIEKDGEFGMCKVTLFSSGTLRQVGTIAISYQYKDNIMKEVLWVLIQKEWKKVIVILLCSTLLI